ncbi:DUF4390 domain-containing protein [Herbaspirillum sp. RTI4]|uniref:DUF4390 domain-containing protein n=1 Tax=Herbaspirillum sp. RTI4 TaxID=3048640 RepID=UPI002AB561D8|nr:DUF4390 domain-containing protein [Herbaspirillum sp. RTI4]MDY7577299.1 DUF4390 domain-containing protein [Herbaspirillum sp. RTI4]MEA9982935.1 DUF4390 domain-containing protein [Herbaspirillum sp. RTI4]
MARCWRACLTALLLCVLIPAHAAEIELAQASLESTDEGYRLATSYTFELNHGLEDALVRGVPLYFTTDLQLTRKRWYWLDETAISTSRTIRLSYNVLTRQYHAAVTGQLQQNFSSLDDALSLLRRPNRWLIAEKGTLKSGEVYAVSLRMYLDVAQLPKPFQINALNNSDWRFSSDWKTFSFKPE